MKTKKQGTQITACKHDNECANTVLALREHKPLFYTNAKGKIVLTDPNILTGLNDLMYGICCQLVEEGSIIIKNGD